MANELQEKLDAILEDKNTNLLPEHLKAGVTCLGVEGTLETSATTTEGIKHFSSIEDLHNDKTMELNDLAVVYDDKLGPVEIGDITNCITFPKTVTLDNAITSNVSGNLSDIDLKVNYRFYLKPASFEATDWQGNYPDIEYTSTDGITYTRTDTNPDYYEFSNATVSEVTDDICKFLLIDKSEFYGLYKATEVDDLTKPKLVDINNSRITMWGNPELVFSDIRIDYVPTTKYYAIVATDKNNYTIYKSDTDAFYIGTNGMSTFTFLELTSATSDDNYDMTEDIYVNGVLQNTIHHTPSENALSQTSSIVRNKYICNLSDKLVYLYSVEMCHRCYYNSEDTSIPLTDTGNDVSKLEWGYEPKIEYLIANSQLDLIKDHALPYTFYGKNGVETGTISQDVSTGFGDGNAYVYSEIQKAYDKMEPIVLNNGDDLDDNIYIIPVRSDGTVLLDTSNITELNYLFYRKMNLTHVPLINTSNLTYMGNMFCYCTSLQSIALIDTSNSTGTYYMFGYCENLTSVPQFDFSKVTNANGTFSGCKKLRDLPVFNLQSVTQMQYFVNYCDNLSDESLNNIMASCATATGCATKTLSYIGLTTAQRNKCKTLSNYAAFTAAGWTA